MGLSCSCDYDFDGGYGESIYMFTSKNLDFKPLNTSKRKRCCSCGKLIGIGELCLAFKRYRYPYNDIEADILEYDWNDEPPIRIADHYHCEDCGEIYLNLYDIGYECILPCEKMSELLKEYHELSGFGYSTY